MAGECAWEVIILTRPCSTSLDSCGSSSTLGCSCDMPLHGPQQHRHIHSSMADALIGHPAALSRAEASLATVSRR